MKKIGLKKKVLSLLFASAVVIPTAFLVSACGEEPEPEKLSRENNVEVVNILQDYQGSVLVEVENFYHEGYEVASDEGITSSSLEFSINGSEWARGDYIPHFYDQYNKAIYEIMRYDDPAFKMSYLWSDDSFAVGETVNISVRIPESDTYKASEGKNVASYTLKNVPSNISDSFYLSVDTTPDNIAISDVEGSEFTFYVDGARLKIGRYKTSPSEDDDNNFDRSLIRFDKLTEQDKTELDALNLEYKLLDYNPALVNEAPVAGTNYVSEEIGDIDFAENYFHTVSPMEWTSLKQIRYTVNTNVPDNKIWDLNSYVEDGLGGYEIQNNKYLVLLVRRGETQSTGVSEILQIDYNFSQTSSLLDTSGDYVKLEMITTDDGPMPEVTSTTLAMTAWMDSMEATAVDGYSGVIKIDYSDSTGDYELQGTVANKYIADASSSSPSLQKFETDAELSDLINGSYYFIEGTVDTDTTSGNENTTNLTIKNIHGQELEHIINSDVDPYIFKALQIDLVTNMGFSGDIQYFECVDENYLKLKMTFDDGEAYYIFDSNGNFVGHKITTSIEGKSYSVEFRIN